MPTHHRGSPREVRALDVFIKLSRACDSLQAPLDRALGELGLTTGQLGILEALLHLGTMCQRDLGEKLLRSNSNVTTVLDNLEKGGLIRRERRQDDRRVVDVSLTGKGRTVIEKVFPRHAANIADLFDGLTAGEQEQLGKLCKKLGLAIHERDRTP